MYDMKLAQVALLAVGDLRQRAVLPAALPRARRHAAPHPRLLHAVRRLEHGVVDRRVRLRPVAAAVRRTSSGSACAAAPRPRPASGKAPHGLEWTVPSPAPYHTLRRAAGRQVSGDMRTEQRRRPTSSVARIRCDDPAAGARGARASTWHSSPRRHEGAALTWTRRRRQARSLAARAACCVMVAGSFAFGFALVPLYDVICEVAGHRSTRRRSRERAVERGRRRPHGDASSSCRCSPTGGDFELTPEANAMHVHPASSTRRSSDRAATLDRPRSSAQAVPSIAPITTAQLLPQDRVLLLHAAVVRASARSASSPCGSSSIRRCPRSSTASRSSYSMYDVPAQKLAAR